MKVTFLGTGTSQGIPVIGCQCKTCLSDDPRDDRLRTSLHIEHKDTSIVVDTGPDFRQQMLHNKVQKLDAILITHEHNDHVIGLDDIRSFNFLQRSEIPLYATKVVIEELHQRFHYIFGGKNYPGIPMVSVIEIHAATPFTINKTEILPIEVMHGKLPVLGFRIEDFTYITDANDISERTLKLIEGTEILVLNALHKRRHHSHYNLEEAIEMAKKIGAKKTYLIHIGHHMGQTADWEKELPENIHSAYDGLVLEIM